MFRIIAITCTLFLTIKHQVNQNRSSLSLLLAENVCVIHQTAAFHFCKCRDQGKDVCNCNKDILSPRPYPIQLPRIPKHQPIKICKEQILTPPGPKHFSPISDPCNCGHKLVKPAPLPRHKPNCQHQPQPTPDYPPPPPPPPTCSCHNKDCGHAVRAPDHYQNFGHDDATIYFETSKPKASHAPAKPKYVPADIVSISIANQLAKTAKLGISERNLQYGSLKEPTVQFKSTKKHSINEESFYDTKGSILEIKPHIFKHEVVSSEEVSEEEKPNPKSSHVFNPAHLSYDQIGYKPYDPAGQQRYVVVRNSEVVKHDCNRPSSPKFHHHKKESSCGCHKDLLIDQANFSEHESFSHEFGQDHWGGKFTT
ncbi:CLUMA_CG010915, isoform A [Clunio marinus]|uniref:CLUMA_CG010915, isoform A n=1 Tax=Clunio marinus TaxID=568069 RepID=A0A1J1IEU8_9DIPT|nr:CLUMA_CG010915, isoform A [Clunio marinus]